jgi:hypothetical protein
LAKNTKILAHEVILLTTEIRTLRKANKTLSKYYKSKKKTRVRQGDTLTIKDARDILAQKDIEEQVQRDKYSKENKQNKGQSITRYYNTCGKTSHNT